MNNEVILKEPRASITWPLGVASADSVKLSASINLNPLVEFTAFSGKEAAVNSNRVLNTDAAALMGAAQGITHSGRSSSDSSVSIDDGDNQLTFAGFLTGPSYRMSKGMLAPSFSMVSAAALMSNLKLDIYQVPGNATGDSPMSKGLETVAHKVREGNLAKRLSLLTTEMVANWRRHKDQLAIGDTPLSASYKERRDTANHNGPMQAWLKLLDNSKDSLDNDWLAGLEKNLAVNHVFNLELLSMLQGTSRDFLDVIASINGSFQLVMIPSRDGGPGKLITMTSLLTTAPEELQLPAASMFLQGDSGSSLMPVQQIVVKDVPKQRVKMGEKGSQAYQLTGGASVVGAFPEGVEASAGDVEFVSLPFFLSRLISWSSPQARDRGNGAPTLDALRESVQTLTNRVTQFQDATVNKLIQDYARSLYVDRALGFTRTSIQIPLDVSLWPGTRYRVTDSLGGELFRGFLSGVQHSLDKKAMGGGGPPSTTLDFTHIEFPGFTLPGLDY